MINYVWMALIVIAVLFAGYNDIRKTPLKVTPEPEKILAFPDGLASGEFTTERAPVELPGRPAVEELPVLAYDLTVERALVFPVVSDVVRTVRRTREGTTAPETFTANSLRFLVLGDGQGARLVAHFENAEGQLFVAQGAPLITWENEWKHVSVSFDRVVPDAVNPAATAGFPMRLVGVEIRRPANVEEMEGRLFLGEIDIVFPEQSRVGASVASSSWMGVITKSSANYAATSINLAIQLIGIMMLWLGLMRIAEQAGMVRFIAKLLKPIMVRLFPELPPESDAMGAIVMNISANMLGLGNAATPLGLKAMQELQELNERKEYASNAMCMLLALNTSSVTLITPAIIGFRAASGSGNIMQFWPVMIIVTVCSTIAGVAACKILEKMPIFRIPPPEPGELVKEEATS